MTDYTADFEMFWSLYPKRWDRDGNTRIKRKKRPAFEKWVLLNAEIRAECLGIAHKISDAEGSSARDCVTWINQKAWEEMRPPQARPTGPQVQDMIQGLLKEVPKAINFAMERNKQMDALEDRPGYTRN